LFDPLYSFPYNYDDVVCIHVWVFSFVLGEMENNYTMNWNKDCSVFICIM
jgi:hypothetical protein